MPRIIGVAWALGISAVIILLILMSTGTSPTRAVLGFVIQAIGLLSLIRGSEDVKRGSTNQGEVALFRKDSPVAFWLTVCIRSFIVGAACVLVGLWVALTQ